MHAGHCVVILLSCCCHVGALDDCHVVGFVLRMWVHNGHFVVSLLWFVVIVVHWMIAMLLSFCCHFGAFWYFVLMLLSFAALDDCHVVVIVLPVWCMLACCCHFVVMWCIGCLPCCCHVVFILVHVGHMVCHVLVIVLSFWSIG